MRFRLLAFFGLVLGTSLVALISTHQVTAADQDQFSLQVTPSPLAATLKPGQVTTIELKIRNSGPKAEVLKVEPRKFKVTNNSDTLELSDTEPSEIADWLSFKTPTFTIQPGQIHTLQVDVNVPKEAGFSYWLALIISRTQPPNDQASGRVLRGSVAAFTLLNIDRPDAKRELKIASFKADSAVYSYLPARFMVEISNTGNTIAQPAGNIFIQRGANDETPIDVLPLNSKNSYILPGTTRTLTVEWTNGFQVEKTITQNGTAKKELTHDWNNLNNLRFGPYTAKMVGVYNDGRRDIPMEAQTGFWVIPWFIVIALVVMLGLVGIGIWTILRKLVKTTTSRRKPSSRRFGP